MTSRWLRESLLTYSPAVLAPALWAYSTYPERLGWTSEVSRWVFGAVAAVYDELTELEEYGEPLEHALMDLRATPKNILDLATGTGFVARRLKNRYPGAHVAAVDISPEMVAIADQQARDEGLEISFSVGDLAHLPFQDSAFDLVVLQNAMPFTDELMRVVQPRGRALMVFSFGGPWVSLSWPAVEARLQEAGAGHLRSKRVACGFYGSARKGL